MDWWRDRVEADEQGICLVGLKDIRGVVFVHISVLSSATKTEENMMESKKQKVKINHGIEIRIRIKNKNKNKQRELTENKRNILKIKQQKRN